jgi:hypothetical protein
MARMTGLMSSVVFVVVLTGYAVFRTSGFDAVGATSMPAPNRASRHNDITVGSGGDEAIFAPSMGSGPRSLEEQENECSDDGGGPAECND